MCNSQCQVPVVYSSFCDNKLAVFFVCFLVINFNVLLSLRVGNTNVIFLFFHTSWVFIFSHLSVCEMYTCTR